MHVDNLPSDQDAKAVVALLNAALTPMPGGVACVDLKSERYGFIYFTTAEGKAAALAKATTEVAGSVARLSEPKSAPFGGKPARKPSRKV